LQKAKGSEQCSGPFAGGAFLELILMITLVLSFVLLSVFCAVGLGLILGILVFAILGIVLCVVPGIFLVRHSAHLTFAALILPNRHGIICKYFFFGNIFLKKVSPCRILW
jgi:hypothetical protein